MANAKLNEALEKLRKLKEETIVKKCEESFADFVINHWEYIEPSKKLVLGWPFYAICIMLQCVTNKTLQKIIMNVPPGFMKTLLTQVFWPAWEWGPRNLPGIRYVCFSYSSDLTEKANSKFLALINCPVYRRRWGNRFTADGGSKEVKNNHFGTKLATSIGGIGTGFRGDRIILDDLNKVGEAESKRIKEETNRWIRETMPTRVNDLVTDAIICIQQRVAEDDATGTIAMAFPGEYAWMVIPMRYEGQYDRRIFDKKGELVWEDPRTEEGELAWPERWPEKELDKLEAGMDRYAVAGQMQQTPVPRSGGIITRSMWQTWTQPNTPPMRYIVASLDTAITDKETSNYSALTVWGSFMQSGVIIGDDSTGFQFLEHADPRDGYNRIASNEPMDNWMGQLKGPEGRQIFRERLDQISSAIPRVILLTAWMKKVNLSGLIKAVLQTCEKFRVDCLVIENKAHGHAVQSEIQEQFVTKPFSIVMFDPKRYGDKTARLTAIEPTFSEGLVYACADPNTGLWKESAQLVIDETAIFPKGANDDIPDTVSMAILHLKERGFAPRKEQAVDESVSMVRHKGPRKPLYDV